jgi:hypothetical protein
LFAAKIEISIMSQFLTAYKKLFLLRERKLINYSVLELLMLYYLFFK